MAHAARLPGLARPARNRALGALFCSLLVQGPAVAATLDAGLGHNLAVTPAGEVWAWGMNERGQLGNATTFSTSIPVRAGALSAVIAVAAGDSLSVALRSDNTVWTWGGGLGLGAAAPQSCTISSSAASTPVVVACSRSPLQVPGLTGITAIAAGGSHVLALRSDGTVAAWGANGSGQLGDGTTTTRVGPVDVPGLAGVVAIAAGSDFSLALKGDGTVWSWGMGSHGQLGYTPAQTCSAVDPYTLASPTQCMRSPAAIPGLAGVTAISSRGRHVLVLKSDQSVWAWGSGRYGQLGEGATGDRFVPIAVPGMSPAGRVEAGFNYSFVVKADGTFWAFGLNHQGQLGLPGSATSCPAGLSIACVKAPAAVPLFDGAANVVAGGAHTLVVRTDGTIAAFGINASGQRGSGAGPFALTEVFTVDPHTIGGAGTVSSGGSLGTASSGGGLNLAALDDGLRFTSAGVGVTSTAAEVRFTNLEEAAIGVLGVAANGDFSAANNDCPASLPASTACSIFVTFTPTGPGERLGTLTVNTSSAESPSVMLELSGTTPPVLHALNVVKSGTGSGTVTSLPAGIDCGSACAASFDSTTQVELTAVPAAGSTFAGWTGDCGGMGTCQLAMSTARNVTATFTAIPAGPPVPDTSQLAFGNQPVGTTSAAQLVTLTNPAATGITILSIATAPPFAATHDCGALAAGGSCTATVRFSPAFAGPFAGNLVVDGSAGDLVLPLTGTGTPNPPRLGNISTRMQVLSGNDVMIGGFVIGGSTTKRLAIVATGPSLSAFGIANPLANPMLTLVRSSDHAPIASNDDWQSAANHADLAGVGFAPSNALEAAILIDLAPGAYTAIVEGVGGGTGVSVIGVYEVDQPETPLINISTRGRVLTGNDVMIGGFVITGTAAQTVAIVATGPSLAAHGIASPLADPKITLVRQSGQVTVATNDDWQADGNASQLQAAGFAPPHQKEAGLLITLQPGAYTAVVEGASGGTGVAVIGVYKAGP
jgi:alpha-tubulin suppressor-like RCC1 family protein